MDQIKEQNRMPSLPPGHAFEPDEVDLDESISAAIDRLRPWAPARPEHLVVGGAILAVFPAIGSREGCVTRVERILGEHCLSYEVTAWRTNGEGPILTPQSFVDRERAMDWANDWAMDKAPWWDRDLAFNILAESKYLQRFVERGHSAAVFEVVNDPRARLPQIKGALALVYQGIEAWEHVLGFCDQFKRETGREHHNSDNFRQGLALLQGWKVTLEQRRVVARQ